MPIFENVSDEDSSLSKFDISLYDIKNDSSAFTAPVIISSISITCASLLNKK